MKTKIVLWGANEADEKLLLGIELVDKENKVLIHKIPEATATEEIYKSMMDDWREGKEITWPEGHTEIIRELSVADGLLPDDIKVERTDLIARAKAEWHFVVLSSKLYEMYHSEVEDFKEKVDQLNDFDNRIWEDLKTFWSKVQNQVQDKNLFRDHANKLRKKTNELFDSLKALKKTADSEFKAKSKEVAAEFKEKIKEIDEKIEKGLGLKPIFEELKKLQHKVKDAAFTRDDRNTIWKKIDNSFKAVKEKRFGDKASGNNSATSRLESRYNGLISAINRMQGSIKKDVNEKNFQNKRINTTDGQLEAQIRQAKLVMIDERINSKQVKLDDMLKTKVELEQKIEREKAREAARAEKEKAKAVAKELKEKVKEEIAAKRNVRTPEEEAELKKAAEAIAATKQKRAAKEAKNITQGKIVSDIKSDKEKVNDLLSEKAPESNTTEEKKDDTKDTLLGAITATMGEAVEDVVDTVKAISQVVSDTVEDKVDDLKSNLADDEKSEEKSILQSVKEAVNDTVEKVKEAGESAMETVEAKMDEEKVSDKAKSIMDKISDAVEDVVDKAKVVSAKVAEEVEEKIEEAKSGAEKMADKVETKIDDAKQSAEDSEQKGGLFGAVTGALSDAVDAVKEMGENVVDKIEDTLEDLSGEEE